MRTSLALIGLMLLAGCGFQLRGHHSFSSQYPVFYMPSGQLASPLGQQLARQLARDQVSLKAGTSTPRLQIGPITVNRQILSLDSRGHASEYRLSYRLDFYLDREGKERITLPVSVQRDFQYQALNALASESEENLLKTEMQALLAAGLLRSLDAVLRSEHATENPG